ncbi:MAG: RNA-protein complex protein Nop10 [Methanosarcinaceae archaeon]|nr:RNA-protein complex protein Nop10 [Methanosarcinaceae archaeon]
MGVRIRKCVQCRRYTMEETCPICSGITINTRPARFSPLDPYGKYRRLAKRSRI